MALLQTIEACLLYTFCTSVIMKFSKYQHSHLYLFAVTFVKMAFSFQSFYQDKISKIVVCCQPLFLGYLKKMQCPSVRSVIFAPLFSIILDESNTWICSTSADLSTILWFKNVTEISSNPCWFMDHLYCIRFFQGTAQTFVLNARFRTIIKVQIY